MIVKNSNGCYCDIAPNFGIVDGFIKVIDRNGGVFYIGVSIILFLSLTLSAPSKWYLWILVSMIIAWQFIAILIPLYLLESFIWWLVHPRYILFKLKSMTDTRFKWLSGCVTVAVIAIAGMIIFSPGKSRSSARSERGVGEYVYVDDYGIVHADRKCTRLNYKGMTSERVRVVDFRKNNGLDVCAKCVSDKAYEQLMNLE